MRPSALNVDVIARALRERFELVVLGDDDHAIADSARALFWFCAENSEYALCRMWPPAEAARPVEPKRIATKFETRCKGCSVFLVPGAEVWWMPGEKGVSCLKCGGTP